MSGPAANAQWYLARDGEQFGPISEAEMAKLVELGHLKPTDLLWREGFPDWRPAMVVFPPRARPMPGPAPGQASAGQRVPHGDARRPAGRMMAEPLAAAPEDRAGYGGDGYTGYGREEVRRRPGAGARVARLMLFVAVLAAAGGAGYAYRTELQGLIASLPQSTSQLMPVGERRSLELPPLAGFAAGSPEAVDKALQDTALWKVIKREFPDWYNERITEAVQMAKESKDEAVIAQLMGRKLAELRRKLAGAGISATAEKLKAVAVTFSESLKRLKGRSPEACSGFIRHGEAEPLIAALLQQATEHTAHLQAHLTAVFEAIADGRQVPRVHPRPSPEHHEMLQSELAGRGWTADDFALLSSNLAQAPPDKVCQLVGDFFAAHLALSDPEAQTRLLVNSLRPVFVAG